MSEPRSAAVSLPESRDDAWSEAQRLRSLNRDLISLLAQPAIGTGQTPAEVIKTLADVLLSMLRVDFAYARATLPGESAIEAASARSRPDIAQRAPELGAALQRWMKTDTWNTPITIENPVESGEMRLLVARFGLHEDSGVVAIGSRRSTFPTDTEALLFRIAINQAVIGFQGAQLLQEHQRVLHVTNTPLAMIEQDAQFRITSFSPRAETLFGWRAEDVVGRRSEEIPWVPEEDWPSVRALMRDLSAGLRATNVHASRNLRKDGSVINCEWYNSALYDADGKLVSVLSLVLDVTERVRAEQARRASEDRLHRGLRGARMVAWSWDAATDRLDTTDNARELFGRPMVTRGADGWPLIHPDDVERHRRIIESAMHDGGQYQSEYRVPLDDGRVMWVSERGEVQKDAAGGVQRTVGVTLDVTERKQAEEALRASEEKLRLAQEAADMGSWDWNLLTGEIVMSDRCLELFGHPAGTVLTRETCLAAVHPEDRERSKRATDEALASGKDYEIEMRVLHPDGTVRWVSARGRGVHDARGKPVRLTGMSLDITDRKRAEEALRESDRRKSEFLAVLSHELRNPLAPIRNSVHLLERAPSGSEQAGRAIDVIRRQSEHLTRLVDDLLDVTRISRGKIELHRERIDLRDVVRRTCDDHRTLFEGRRIELRVEMSGPVWIDADSTRIAQAVGNLLQNAAKFSREGGMVSVTIGAVDSRAEIRVRDDGIGVAPDLLPRIFEPFVQAAGGLARTKGGLGLGLALVKALVELHGGSVVARSEGPERGSEFVVTLPLAAAPRETAPGPARSAAPARAEVLIIEDNVDAAQTIAEVLEMEGHHVTVATDGRSGLERARELVPEMILCDIGLPDVDGYEIARRLRAEEAFRSTRLIAVSGYAQLEDRRRAKEAGFDAHVSKPASLEDLLASMRGRRAG